MNETTATLNKLKMPLIQVRAKAQITLPSKAREILGIKEGDYLEAKFEKKQLVLKPKMVLDKFPTAKLSKKGEKILKEALDDVKNGRVLNEYEWEIWKKNNLKD